MDRRIKAHVAKVLRAAAEEISASSQIARKDNGRPRGSFLGSADGWEYTEGYPLGLRGGWAASIGLSSQNNWMNLSVEGATEYDANFRRDLKEIVAAYPEVAQYVVSFDGPFIPVSSLLETEPEGFSDIVFLHGTSSVVVPSIMAEGLRPRSETGVEPAYGHASSARPSVPDRIYLTTQLTMAKAAARNAASVHGGDPVILEVTGLNQAYALPDEDSGTQTAEESLAKLGSIAYSRTIPPSKIRAVNGKVSAADGWHGSHKAFDIFDISKLRRGEFGPGFYFADDKEEAERYGPAKQYVLDIQSPLEIGSQQHLDMLLGAFPIEQRYKDLIRKSSVGFETLFNLLEQKYKLPPEMVISQLQDLGFDGIRVDNGEQKFWVAFSPEQIKQAVSDSSSGIEVYVHSDGDYGTGVQVVASLDEEPVGHIDVYSSPSSLNGYLKRDYVKFIGLPKGKIGYLGGIEIPSEMRGKGTGRKAVSLLIKEASKLGISGIALLSTQSAFGFWKKMGWVVADAESDDGFNIPMFLSFDA